MSKLRWPLLVMLAIMLDLLSKYLVETSLTLYERIDIIPFLSLYRTYNEGVAFSFLSSFGSLPLIIMTLLIIVFVIWLWSKLEPWRWVSGAGYALVLGGAIGNLADRIRLGKVTDFILFHTETWSFAVFNLADTFITIGAALIILDEFLEWKFGPAPSNKTQDKDAIDG